MTEQAESIGIVVVGTNFPKQVMTAADFADINGLLEWVITNKFEY